MTIHELPRKKVDLVFEGGGVKGIAYVGALKALEDHGYKPNSLAGTSAGAIVASLIAVGYKPKQLEKILWDLDFEKLKDKSFVDHLPFIGGAISIFIDKGIYEGNYLEKWLRKKLKAAPSPATTFGELKKRLKIVATDISRGTMLVLPDGIKKYGLDPDKLDIAFAVRMSMSIPFFFEPVVLDTPQGTSYIVDGCISSNFPINIFNRTDGPSRWPTFGLRLVEPNNAPNQVSTPFQMFSAIFSTMMATRDAREMELNTDAMSVEIFTGHIKATDFDLNDSQKRMLVESGRIAMEEFMEDTIYA